MWYFVAPQIVFGEGALEVLRELAGRRALVVTDTTLLRLGIVERVAAHLRAAGLEVVVYDAVEADPSVEPARAGAVVARDCRPDWIIGLGGGSAMDAAKAIWVLYERPALQPEEIHPFAALGLRPRGDAQSGLITIPTTSGTGAEATWAIVLTDRAARRKMGLGNREAVADLAVVDPSLAVGMPPRLTADTGLDVLAHAIEGYTCTWHNDLTDGLCIQAIRLCLAYLRRAVADGGDLEAREHMHNAATCAGLGFGNAMASLAHAMGHALGAVFHQPHGRAVGLFLPYSIEFAARQAPERFAELEALCRCAPAAGEQGARALAGRVRALAREIGSPLSLAEMGIGREQLAAELTKLVDDAANDTQMVTAVRSPSYEELEQLYLYAHAGRSIDF